YALVADRARVSFPAAVVFEVVERVPGGPATAFAAPDCRRPFPQNTATGDTAAIEDLRHAIAAVLGAPSDGSPVVSSGWTTRYAARRIAWHVLEHAWEMQDRADS